MEKIEILSPVGDKTSFYASIRSGCDAVYLGLPKFNARLKAENISLENLFELVQYAHLKNVKVYVTMNTLLSNAEIKEAVALAGECLKAGVDAFIVQDLGLISLLKTTYPKIVLHGSTQLGVHNVRGAKVAKSLGLSRIVLSRECTLADIESIIKNVDIETEIFVQGANCICFSGNCYLSSIMCGASGNRGECKQLCRLPFTLTDNQKELKGYTLSPRDNCMLEKLNKLMSLGVTSLKIEGRLRQVGYVTVATSIYRRAVDSILQGVSFDISQAKSDLSRVFARGEYTSGYMDNNCIVDPTCNNHLGVYIGTAIGVNKFKDLFKVTMDINKNIVTGDGLKFVFKDNTISVGVGNVERFGKNTIVFVKNKIDIGAKVYLSHDTTFESSIADYSKHKKLEIYAEVIGGKNIVVEYSCENIKVKKIGDIVEFPRTVSLDPSRIKEQLSRVDPQIFEVSKCDVVSDNAYVAISTLNEIRRTCINELISKLTRVEPIQINDIETNSTSSNRTTTFDKLAIVNEYTQISTLSNTYDALILSPQVYSTQVISKFESNYHKYFKSPLIISLPIICRTQDQKIIDECVDKFKSNCIFVANNIYALSYADTANIWAGTGLNIVNEYSAKVVSDLGVKEIIGSFEKWTSRISSSYKASASTLMTITSCPVKLLYGCDCASCKYNNNLKFVGTNFELKVSRIKIANCYFELMCKSKNYGNINIEDKRI